MKVVYLLLLLAVSTAFCDNNYKVPDLDYDQTDPSCDNINHLIANTYADIARLSNYATVTLPSRLSKTGDALGSVQKTCQIISSKRPSLVQFNSAAAKHKMMTYNLVFKQAAKEAFNMASALFQNLEKGFPVFLNMEVLDVDADDLCDDASDSLDSLKDYLNWLIPTIKSEYIQGVLADRLNDLIKFNNKCTAAACGDDDAATGDDDKSPVATDDDDNAPATGDDDNAATDTDDDGPVGDYVFYSTLDTSPYDIGRFSGTIKQLKRQCDKNPDCLAFNSDGWFKSTVRPPSEWSQPYGGDDLTWGLYVKGERPDYQDYTWFPVLDTSPHDIMRVKGPETDDLELYCDTNPDCVAFNDDGWIKNYVRPPSQWSIPYPDNTKWGLHVKNINITDYDYDYYPTQDVSPYDIMQIKGVSTEQLKQYCNYNPDCKGFNSDGWIKNAIPMDDFSQPYGADVENWGLYVKKVPGSGAPATIDDDDNAPAVTEEDDNAPAVTEEEDNAPAATEEEDNAPGITEEDDNAPAVTEEDDNAPAVTEEEDNAPAVTEEEDNAPAATEEEDNAPAATDDDDAVGDYVFYSTLDTSPYDIGKFSGTIDELKRQCDKNPDCKAFNSDGWFKSTVRPPSEWSQPYGGADITWGLYVKGERPDAQDYTWFPVVDTSPYDIMRVKGAETDALQLYCDTNPDCVAFNDDGWTKSYVKPPSQWSIPYPGNTKWGLHVKNIKVTDYDYDYYPTKDVSPYDIMQLKGLSTEQLKHYCNYNPDCKAFNSDGWIKNQAPLDKTSQPYGADVKDWGLYVKKLS